MYLSAVEHQPRAHTAIERAMLGRRVPHAYVFHGPNGVGKETFARGFAQLLLCPNAAPTGPRTAAEASSAPADGPSAQEGEPGLFGCAAPAFAPVGSSECSPGSASPVAACGHCIDCRMVIADTHPDWNLVHRHLNRAHPDPEVRRRKGLDLGVDVLRHFLIDKVGFTPTRGRAKVFVVREADRITTQAQNALLKTLEEPPGTTYLILLVSAIDRLLPTTLSRCQVVAFDPLPVDFVRERLRGAFPQLASPQLHWYSDFAEGSIGAGMQAVDDRLFDVDVRVRNTLAPLARAATAGRSMLVTRRGECIKAWTDEAGALGELYQKRDAELSDTEASRRGWRTVLRMLADACAGSLRETWERDVPRSAESTLGAASNPVAGSTAERAADAIQRIALAERHLELNANVQLVIETLATDLAVLLSTEPVHAGR